MQSESICNTQGLCTSISYGTQVNCLDGRGPHTWGMLIQGVATNDVSDHTQPGSTNLVSAIFELSMICEKINF